jgi:hypothetical protein
MMADDWLGDAFRSKIDRRYGAAPEAEPEPELDGPPTVPDLGQGARGPIPSSSGPNMSDVIRGSVHAQRAHVDEEIEAEFHFRTMTEKAP